MVVFSLFNTIFGASPHSKLFENVREKLSLCYYCASRLEKHKGLLLVYGGIENDNKQKAFEEILKQLEDIKNGQISENEFLSAKKSLKNAFISSADSSSATEDFYLSNFLLGKTKSPAEFAAFLDEITVSDIVNAAKTVLLDTVYFLKGKTE
jgi:predicted Zn-dependent peptidase